MEKFKQLEKTLLDLITKDDLIIEHFENLKNLGFKIVKNDAHLQIDYKTLSAELLVDLKLGETSKFMNRYDIEDIDFDVKNFAFEIESLKLNDKDAKEGEDKKIIRMIEEEVNIILEDLLNEYYNIGSKVEELLEKNFHDYKDNSEADFKEKMNDFIKSYKTKRIKKFVESTIKSSVKTKRTEEHRKYKKYRNDILDRFFNKDGVHWTEWKEFFISKSLHKERRTAMKKLINDLGNYLEDIIDEAYIDLAKENFEMQKTMDKKFKNKDNEVIEIDKRRLLNEGWKQSKLLFDRAGFSQSEFKRY